MNKITTIEMHTGGEPLRIITGGIPEIHGKTILEKRRYFMENLDYIRTATMFEPRGHADMYGAIVTDPVNKGSDFGTFFLHNDGYSTMCGHAIIALTKYVIEMGVVKKTYDDPVLRIDAPPGLIISRARMQHDKVIGTSFLNVPSFVLLEDKYVEIENIGKIRFDLAFGGAFYAIVNADQLDLKLDASDYQRLIDTGKKIKQAVIKKINIKHPYEKELSFLYGTIFTGAAYDKKHHSRNVCIFANGEVDRSATGSGVSARAALHFARGELAIGEKITIESILGTTMDVAVKEIIQFGPHNAIVPEVSGQAYFIGKSEFWFDPDDPLRNGFIFR